MDRSQASLNRRSRGRSRLFREAARLRPRLEALGERLAPGDAVLGGLLGWGVIAAADVPYRAVAERSGVAHRSRLPADLADHDTLPNSGAWTRLVQGLSDPGSPQAAPASRLVAEGQGNALSSASAFITAPA